MTDVCFCGTPEAQWSGSQPKRTPHASWALVSDLPGLLHDAVRQAITQAFAAWSRVANVLAEETQNPAGADLIVSAAPIDGPQGVLAETELPGPRPQHMTVDVAETWTVHLGTDVPGGRLDLERVLTHEIGHFWGLGHDTTPGSQALMAPTYNPRVDRPGAWDTAQMQGRYGRPAPTPAPPPPPSPDGVDLPDVLVIIGQSGKETARFKLLRVA